MSTIEFQELMDQILPPHPHGALGMFIDSLEYAQAHEEEWHRECEAIDRKRMAEWN